MGCGSSAHEGRNSEQLPTTPPSSKRDSPFETFQPPREYKEGDPLPRVWFQISINRIVRPEPLVFELFADVAPKTAENFRCLCTGERGRGPRSKVPLHFKGTKFHRIIPRFMAQGGDIEDRGGVGGESIFGRRFPDETFEGRAGRHVGLGTLSMANRGPDTNASQFFICFADTPHLDGKHVVFGQVVSGFETLKAIEAMGTKHGAPKGDVTIVDCGEGAEAGRGYRSASLISVQLHSDSGSGGSTGIITHTNTGSGAGSSTSLRPRDAGNSGGLRSVVGENDAGQLHSGSETESTTKINTTFAEASTSADELDREADREKRFASNSEPPAHLIGNYE